MKKNNFFLTVFVTLIIGIFLGYENPKLVEFPKKIYKYFFSEKKTIAKKQEPLEEKRDVKEANSFELKFERVASFNDRAAFLNVISSDKNILKKYEIVTSDAKIDNGKKIQELNIPFSFFNQKNGGVRAAFKINDNLFGLISNKNLNCYFASLVNFQNGKEIIRSKCLPDEENIDFSGLGGGYTMLNGNILISIGTPTHASEIISSLAQDPLSIFGKIIKININDLLTNSDKELKYEIYSSGHRNPQGIASAKNNIYSIEHGPHGGDEINLIKYRLNYGWPKFSYGLPYAKDKKYEHKNFDNKYTSPIFTFLPAIAPSDLSECPNNLANYYSNNICLMALSLKAMSVFVFLLDNNNKIVSVERINFDERLRHFGKNKKMNLFQNDDNSFFVTSDENYIYRLKFQNFVK